MADEETDETKVQTQISLPITRSKADQELLRRFKVMMGEVGLLRRTDFLRKLIRDAWKRYARGKKLLP